MPSRCTGPVRGTVDVDVALNWSRKDLLAAETALRSIGLVSRLPISANDVYDFRDEYIANRGLVAWNFHQPGRPPSAGGHRHHVRPVRQANPTRRPAGGAGARARHRRSHQDEARQRGDHRISKTPPPWHACDDDDAPKSAWSRGSPMSTLTVAARLLRRRSCASLRISERYRAVRKPARALSACAFPSRYWPRSRPVRGWPAFLTKRS